MLSVSSRVLPSRFARPKQYASRLRVVASYQCPYVTLGVSATSDEQQIKKAYRKLALQWHPDVSKHEGAEVVFLQLTEAYEFLMAQLHGKDAKDHSSVDWDFHDWYWSFRSTRTWAKQQKAVEDADAPHASTASTKPPPPPSNRANIREQLAGLKHRAAIRATKASRAAVAVSCSDEDTEDEPACKDHVYSHANADVFPSATSSANAAVQSDVAHEVSSTSQPSPASADVSSEAVQDTTSGADTANIPPPYSQTKRKFVAHSGTREKVVNQLAGLRRKAMMANA